jgi:glycerol uptake facilitator-like aquaporin
MSSVDLPRRLAAEALGTGLLVCTVVGSGIMADKLSDDVAVSLLGNTIPTGAILVVLITILGPLSGAHFNPAVSFGFALRKNLPWSEFPPYVVAQIVGGVLGTFAAHLMFELPVVQSSLTVRTGLRNGLPRWSRHLA